MKQRDGSVIEASSQSVIHSARRLTRDETTRIIRGPLRIRNAWGPIRLTALCALFRVR